MCAKVCRPVLLLLVFLQFLAWSSPAALPRRLILALDGVSFRDMKALQEGIISEDSHGRRVYRQAFHQGYFPVSRLVSTFPSASDVAWTEIFGNRPLPGYQRTHFSRGANATVLVNGVSSSMEFERQMTWRMEGGFGHAMSYLFPQRVFKREVRDLVDHFLSTSNAVENYYAYICSTDGAQHMSCDIVVLLCLLDEELERLRHLYRASEGRELEIVILSDHGNNHAGPGRRVRVRSLLERAGYRISRSIARSSDVVLPTVGIESWVEIHNVPAETERLQQLLCGLPGADILTAQAPGQANRFIVMNSKSERALIDWNRGENSFRYTPERGDPLHYGPVAATLRKEHQLDAAGFAPACAWVRATLGHQYPLALERIARGHTTVTLNPATILISLKNGYVHAGWMVKKGSELLNCGGTHGGLDALSSNGMLLSSFARTADTSTTRVAALFDGFPGLRDYRAEEDGAEWVTAKEQALTTVDRDPLDGGHGLWPPDAVFLRIWAPRFAHLGDKAPVELTFRRIPQFAAARIRRGDPDPVSASERRLLFNRPLPVSGKRSCQRIYRLPANLKLEPDATYDISGRIHGGQQTAPLFNFAFRTDSRGRPVAF